MSDCCQSKSVSKKSFKDMIKSAFGLDFKSPKKTKKDSCCQKNGQSQPTQSCCHEKN